MRGKVARSRGRRPEPIAGASGRAGRGASAERIGRRARPAAKIPRVRAGQRRAAAHSRGVEIVRAGAGGRASGIVADRLLSRACAGRLYWLRRRSVAAELRRRARARARRPRATRRRRRRRRPGRRRRRRRPRGAAGPGRVREPDRTCPFDQRAGQPRRPRGRMHDEHGRDVLLRGVNTGGRSKWAPFVPFPIDAEAEQAAFTAEAEQFFARLSGWGVNVSAAALLVGGARADAGAVRRAPTSTATRPWSTSRGRTACAWSSTSTRTSTPRRTVVTASRRGPCRKIRRPSRTPVRTPTGGSSTSSTATCAPRSTASGPTRTGCTRSSSPCGDR